MVKVWIKAGNVKREVELYEDLAPVTVEAILNSLPIKGVVNRWGDEIYFETDVVVEVEENSKEVVEMGDVAYWIPGRAICVFFGPTPISEGDEIRPASAVNVIGKVVGDIEAFREVDDGEEVVIDRALE
ncbi:cyclophilin-like family protein [Archaeoglobus veneficus]|uniref:Cyclophilin TM1367-like domain-containing protein n=1 Tax=Archaeoglobus veneficus (strain DSM 11195 / SNP6) TaxID=693661 RepID=F2KMK6_ARCVS|nr:cyclophilin-like family protein [Archaeoglobus veneficus]AEA47203.1 protein of unknown function DUF369 [Archaeoglobus veneficus SNP6]